jgi:hypothetical protein
MQASELKVTWANNEKYYNKYEDGVLSNQKGSHNLTSDGRVHFDVYGFHFMTFNVKSDYFNRNNNCYPYHFYHS